MNHKYESNFKSFRRQVSQSRFLSLTASFSLFIGLFLTLNKMAGKFPLFENAWIYFIILFLILVGSVSAYVYMYDFRIRKSLKAIDPILYEHCDPEVYTEYLEATIRLDKRKNASPSLWMGYLKGLSYLNEKEKMREIIRVHGDILNDKLQFQVYEFNLMNESEQLKKFDAFYEMVSNKLKDKQQLDLLTVRGYLLKHRFDEANTRLSNIDIESLSLLDQVSWHTQKAKALVQLGQLDAAQTHIDFVIANGNTSYYVEEVEHLL